MYDTTAAFDPVVKSTCRTFKGRITAGDTVLTDDIRTAVFNLGSCGSDTFTFGCVYASWADVVTGPVNAELSGKELFFETGLVLPDGTVEYVPMGYFTVSPAELKKTGGQVSFKASDRISSKCGGIYEPSVKFPATIQAVLNDISAQTGVTIRTALPATGTVTKTMEGLTVREVLGYTAGLLGGFCWCDREGIIKISAYPKTATRDVDADIVMDSEMSGAYSVDTVVVSVSEDGVDENGNDISGVTYTAGTGKGNRVTVSNPYMTQALFNGMKGRVAGYAYRPGEVTFLGDPRLDPEDMVSVTDAGGNMYLVPCMNLVHDFDGGLTTTVAAPGYAVSDSDVQGPLTQQMAKLQTEVVLAKQVIATKVSADEVAAEYATIERADILAADISKVSGDLADYKTVVAGNLTAANGRIDTLAGDLASYKKVVTDDFTATNAEVKKISGDLADYKTVVAGNLSAVNADIAKVTGDFAAFKTGEFADLSAKQADFETATADNFRAANAEITKVSGDFAAFKTGEFADLSAKEAAFETATTRNFTAVNAEIQNIKSTQITTDYLEASFAKIDLANVKDGSITTAMIGTGVVGTAQIADGSITDAKIVGLTANKITAGRLDAAQIEVVNLNAANITVGTINGQQIAPGAIDTSKLSSSLSATIANTAEDVEKALADAGLAQSTADAAKTSAVNAQNTANTAKTNAANAQSTADKAKTDAAAAQTAADSAAAIANAAKSAASSAQSTADGKNTVFYQTAAPSASGRKTNDVWFDTDDANRMYYWNGSVWEARQFGTNAIADAAIMNALIADATIQSAKIANVDAGKITTGTLAAEIIGAGTITAEKIAALAVTAAKIAAGAVETDKLAANAVTAGKIAANAVTAATIAASAVTADKISAKAVTTDKINSLAVTTEKIAAGAITAAKIAAKTITANEIAANTITAAQIRANTVTTQNLALDAIKSKNYIAGSKGSYLNLADGTFDSKYTKWDEEGVMSVQGIKINGGKLLLYDDWPSMDVSVSLVSSDNTDDPQAPFSYMDIMSNGISAGYKKNGLTEYATYGYGGLHLTGSGSESSVTSQLASFGGNVKVKGTLEVSGRSTLKEPVIIQNWMAVSGNAFFNGQLRVQKGDAQNYIMLWGDSEGGNIEIASPDGTTWQMDSWSNTRFRIFSNKNGSMVFPFEINRDTNSVSVNTLVANTRVDTNHIELSGNPPYIDFHFNKSTADYTARIIETQSGVLAAYNSITSASDARLKDNIRDIPDVYLKLFERLKPKIFSYKRAPGIASIGLVAQDVLELEKGLGIGQSVLVRGTGRTISSGYPEKEITDYYTIDYNALSVLAMAYFLRKTGVYNGN